MEVGARQPAPAVLLQEDEDGEVEGYTEGVEAAVLDVHGYAKRLQHVLVPHPRAAGDEERAEQRQVDGQREQRGALAAVVLDDEEAQHLQRDCMPLQRRDGAAEQHPEQDG